MVQIRPTTRQLRVPHLSPRQLSRTAQTAQQRKLKPLRKTNPKIIRHPAHNRMRVQQLRHENQTKRR